jgi:hypothetical protein
VKITISSFAVLALVLTACGKKPESIPVNAELEEVQVQKGEEPSPSTPTKVAPLGRRTESAVLLGLLWLKNHQNPKGMWSTENFMGNCKKQEVVGVIREKG